MAPPLSRLLSLDGRAWIDLWRAQAALLRAQWRLRRQPLGSLAIRDEAGPERLSGDPARASALGLAVERAAEHGIIRPFCLVRAMALRELLRAEGIAGASIRIGVRRNGGEFQAHAWVLWGATVLGDRPEHVARFTEVNDLGVLARR